MSLEILSQRIEVLEKQLSALLESNTSDTTPTNKPKKSKKPKDDSSDSEDKPKTKRTSGYILYSNATRDEVRDNLTTGDERLKNTDIVKELARLWKDLPQDEKDSWNSKAKEHKDAS